MATGPFGSAIGSRFFRRSGIPVIRGGNLSADPARRLRDEDLVFLDANKAAEFSRSIVRRGDLIFTCWGTINQVGLIDETAAYDQYVISNKQMKLTPDPSLADSEFLYYLFSAPTMQREILEGSIGSSVPGFNLTRLRSMEIALPSLEEQRRISRALSDAEQLERALKRRIQKNEAIQRGLAQRLLAGSTRLPGFIEDWDELRLSDLAAGSRGSGLSKSALDSSGASACVLYGELFTTYRRVIGSVQSRTDADGSVLSQRGQVLLPGSTTTVARDLAVACAILEEGVLLGGDINIVTPRLDKVDPVWLAYYLTSQRASQIAEVAQGTTIVHLYVRDVLSLQVSIPSLEEQRAIARVLLDADAEAELLHKRLKKAQNTKVGMMQQLLIGHARLLPQDVPA